MNLEAQRLRHSHQGIGLSHRSIIHLYIQTYYWAPSPDILDPLTCAFHLLLPPLTPTQDQESRLQSHIPYVIPLSKSPGTMLIPFEPYLNHSISFINFPIIVPHFQVPLARIQAA